ncbi:MAG: hypothetical protein Tp152SUR359831_21 [Prokaryotic dsDNA virus sp.]|nr:MAG: hypothetical protein Tp152SUR359831_21 [Prokaryotic dsDNA virus sp.]|tara:strand:+ start:12083 stop:12265 length:183 start_codon:yes stop_codon:yes gene_type:complete
MKIKNYIIENIKLEDYPKFCDAYLSYAEDENGKPFSDNELETWEKENYDKFYQLILESIV